MGITENSTKKISDFLLQADLNKIKRIEIGIDRYNNKEFKRYIPIEILVAE